MNFQKLKVIANAHPITVVWATWVLWGLLLMGMAHTEIVNWSWFRSFRFWVGQVVPTVSHPPPREILDPKIGTTFLAMLWVSSPVLWFAFRDLPAERFLRRVDWSKPFGGKVLLAIGVITICGLAAYGYDFGTDERRMARRGLANPIGFAILASVLSVLPWYTFALLKAWRTKIREYLEHIRE